MSRSCSAGRLGLWEGGKCGVPSSFLLSSLSQSDTRARHRACPERHPGGCSLLGVSCWSWAGSSPGSSVVACVQLPHVPTVSGAEESPVDSLGPEMKLEGQPQQPRSAPMSPRPTAAWVPPGQQLRERRCFCRWGRELDAARPSPVFTWRRLLLITALFYRKKKTMNT